MSKFAAIGRLRLLRLSQAALVAGALLLAVSPLAVGDSYTIVDNTLSESGAQGVAGAWAFRSGVLLTVVAVLMLTVAAVAVWESRTKWLLRVYAGALVMMVVFSEAPWDGSPHDESAAFLHTVFGVIAAVSFILAAVSVSIARPPGSRLYRWFDWAVAAAVALIPQTMQLAGLDGLQQRLMVALGYVWLLVEMSRVAGSLRDDRVPASASAVRTRADGRG